MRKYILFFVAFGLFLAPAGAQTMDTIRFGDDVSEQSHGLQAQYSDVIDGALGGHARRLLARQPVGIDGGAVDFTMKVDPDRPNYFTVRLWGGDAGESKGRLLLFIDGKQIGYRHIGDVDDLDILNDAPRYPGRFVYTTVPLPKAFTASKTEVKLSIRGLGLIWGYGETWDKFQKNFAETSRGIYAGYTHADSFFTPLAEEKQGEPVTDPPVRPPMDGEVIDKAKSRVNSTIDKLLTSTAPLNQMQMQLLARAWHVKWTHAAGSDHAVQRVVDSLDAAYRAFQADPRTAQTDKTTPNPDWFGIGPSGDAIRLLAKPIAPYLDRPVADGGGITRRAAYTQMFVACRDWHRQHRRLYTNQTMISDAYGIYLPNRAIQVCDPSKALKEDAARRYLYESVGLQPWLGDDLPGGGSKKPLGDHYMQLTDKGLTRELGYVGGYGEVLDWVTTIYDATRPQPQEPGDERIRQQLIKIAKTRAIFRYPATDEDGHRAMRMESTVGWRDTHYPGDIAYAQRQSRDASPLNAAATTQDPYLVGYAQQMLADQQFLPAVEDMMKENSFRVTEGLLAMPEEYETIKSLPPSPHKLPMSGGDFVFTDEEDGVVAIRHGDETLYASLYWRARFGINFLARVHYLTPAVERDATAWEDVQFSESGLFYTRDDRRIETQTTRHEKSLSDGVVSAMTGEKLPIAKLPPWLIGFKPGQESVFAGRGDFYQLKYGSFLIAMNTTADQTFNVDTHSPGTDLVSGKPIQANTPLKVAPRTTIILYEEHKK